MTEHGRTPTRRDLLSRLISAATAGEIDLTDIHLAEEASTFIFAGLCLIDGTNLIRRDGYNCYDPCILVLGAKSSTRMAGAYQIGAKGSR